MASGRVVRCVYESLPSPGGFIEWFGAAAEPHTPASVKCIALLSS